MCVLHQTRPQKTSTRSSHASGGIHCWGSPPGPHTQFTFRSRLGRSPKQQEAADEIGDPAHFQQQHGDQHHAGEAGTLHPCSHQPADQSQVGEPEEAHPAVFQRIDGNQNGYEGQIGELEPPGDHLERLRPHKTPGGQQSVWFLARRGRGPTGRRAHGSMRHRLSSAFGIFRAGADDGPRRKEREPGLLGGLVQSSMNVTLRSTR